MEANIKQIVSAYNILGEAKVGKLEESEVIKVVKARKVMRKYADDYNAFINDCQEKFKPEDWDNIQNDLRQWQEEGDKTTLGEERRIELNKALIGYQNKVNNAVAEELNRKVELEFEPLKDESLTKMLLENGWEIKKLDELEILS